MSLGPLVPASTPTHSHSHSHPLPLRSRISNMYFALTMGIALIPGVSPIFPITSILPLVFVLAVAGIKESIEDWARLERPHPPPLEAPQHDTDIDCSTENPPSRGLTHCARSKHRCSRLALCLFVP